MARCASVASQNKVVPCVEVPQPDSELASCDCKQTSARPGYRAVCTPAAHLHFARLHQTSIWLHPELPDHQGLGDNNQGVASLVVEHPPDGPVGLEHLHAGSILIQVVDDASQTATVEV